MRPESVIADRLPECLQVQLLGLVELHCAGNKAEFPTRKSRSIFAFLLINRRREHPREQLAGAFWPNCSQKRSRASLRTELWRIRETIARAGVDPQAILADCSDAVRIMPKAPCRVDVEELDHAIRRCQTGSPTADEIPALEAALQLYAGDLLEGETEDWCLPSREYYRSRFFAGSQILIEAAIAMRDWRRAIEWGETLLLHDPLAEHVHRYLMLCHNALGNRPAAIRQFARFAGVLRSQLDVEPMEITRELYRLILRGLPETSGSLPWQGESATVLRRTRSSLIELLRNLDAALNRPDSSRS